MFEKICDPQSIVQFFMKTDNKKLIAKVIPAVKMPRNTMQVFSYAVPDKFEKKIKIGMSVKVPFRNQKITGLVCNLEKEVIKEMKYKLKDVEKLLDDSVSLSEEQIKLAKHIADYYYVPLGLVIKIIIPLITKNKPRKKIELNPNCKISEIKKTEINKLLKEIKSKNKILFIHNLQSSKHSLYCETIKKRMKEKEQALVLFPEYFDIYNFAKFYFDKFKDDKIAILTSELTKNQYFNEWGKIKNGSAKITIGTRQAVFAPFKNLKLIIADNEQSSNYKQWDMNPRYHGIKVAEKLAEIWKAKIILSSQVPSVESYYGIKNKYLNEPRQSKNKKVPQISNFKRFYNLQFTIHNSSNIDLIDINIERQKGNYSVLSEELQDSLLKNIYKKKQAIIFIPRLGNNTITQCKDCKWIAQCENCKTTLISYANYLYCQKCHKKIELIKKCPKCAGQNISSFGYGSEKIEAEIKKLFENKNIKINRLDSNVASSKSKQLKIYKNFIDRKIDILIGTQMVLKNWNLENLALTAILFPEIIFNQPNFNSRERSFQFLISLCNKASENHRIIIQTYKTDNDIFKTVRKNNPPRRSLSAEECDKKVCNSPESSTERLQRSKNEEVLGKFYLDEIKNRKAISKNKIGYPPFAQLIKLIYKDFNPRNCQAEAERVFRVLNRKITNDKNLKNQFEIIKPFPASNYKEFDKYRWHIIIKSVCKNIELRNSLLNLVKKEWIIDVDPDSVL